MWNMYTELKCKTLKVRKKRTPVPYVLRLLKDCYQKFPVVTNADYSRTLRRYLGSYCYLNNAKAAWWLTCRLVRWRRSSSHHPWWWAPRPKSRSSPLWICSTVFLRGQFGCRCHSALLQSSVTEKNDIIRGPAKPSISATGDMLFDLPVQCRSLWSWSSPCSKPTCTPSTNLEAAGKTTCAFKTLQSYTS